ncbi:hypothetical protein [Methylobacterium sp. SI9]|uniref:hypothetical protein n=1 Tax=Methylobacterium guangdongense TaxID=3138811 RepID=UPI00313E3F2B
MPQESLIPELDELIIVERVAPGEEAIVRGLLRLAVPWAPEGAHLPIVVVTATEHDALGDIRAEVVLFDGGRATLQISLPLVLGGRPLVRWLDRGRQAPIGFDRAQGVWRRYPELALATGDARRALDRLDVVEAEYLLRAERRREAALRGAETRRLNRLAREEAERRGGP